MGGRISNPHTLRPEPGGSIKSRGIRFFSIVRDLFEHGGVEVEVACQFVLNAWDEIEIVIGDRAIFRIVTAIKEITGRFGGSPDDPMSFVDVPFDDLADGETVGLAVTAINGIGHQFRQHQGARLHGIAEQIRVSVTDARIGDILVVSALRRNVGLQAAAEIEGIIGSEAIIDPQRARQVAAKVAGAVVGIRDILTENIGQIRSRVTDVEFTAVARERTGIGPNLQIVDASVLIKLFLFYRIDQLFRFNG